MPRKLSGKESVPHSSSVKVAEAAKNVWTLPFVGLVVFTLAIVTIRFNVATIGIGLAAVGLLFSQDGFRFPKFALFYVIYLVWAAISSVVGPYFDHAVEPLQERFKLLLIILVTVNSLRTAAQVRTYLLMILLFFLVYPFRGAITNYLIGYTVFGRAIWNYTYQNPNDLASLSLMAFGIALAFAFEPTNTRLRKIAYSCSAIGLFVLVLLTQSRGGFIGLALGLGIPLARAAWTRRGGLVLVIIVALLASWLVPNEVWDRLSGIGKLGSAQTIVDADPEGSAEQRFEIAKMAIDITTSSPIFGQGLDSFPYALYERSRELGHRDTHNTYLNLSAEIGIPGLVAWLACVISALRAMRLKQLRIARIQLGIRPEWVYYSIIGFLVAGFFGSYSRLNLLYVMLAVCWSVGQLAANNRAIESQAQRRLRERQQQVI